MANSLLPTVNAFHMTLVRYVTVAAILVILLLVIEGTRHLRFDGKIGTVFWLGALGFAGFGLLAFTALESASATNVALLMAMMPVISMIIGAVAARHTPRPAPPSRVRPCRQQRPPGSALIADDQSGLPSSVPEGGRPRACGRLRR